MSAPTVKTCDAQDLDNAFRSCGRALCEHERCALHGGCILCESAHEPVLHLEPSPIIAVWRWSVKMPDGSVFECGGAAEFSDANKEGQRAMKRARRSLARRPADTGATPATASVCPHCKHPAHDRGGCRESIPAETAYAPCHCQGGARDGVFVIRTAVTGTDAS